MSKYVIGCDPDGAGNGIALFEDGKLIELMNLSAVEFYCRYKKLKGESVKFAIENVKGNKGVFRSFDAKNRGDAGAKGKGVGMCMQAQTEIEKAAEMLGFEIVQRPRSSRWKKKGAQEEEFKRSTGWDKRSNEDKRSAAWMAYQVI